MFARIYVRVGPFDNLKLFKNWDDGWVNRSIVAHMLFILSQNPKTPFELIPQIPRSSSNSQKSCINKYYFPFKIRLCQYFINALIHTVHRILQIPLVTFNLPFYPHYFIFQSCERHPYLNYSAYLIALVLRIHKFAPIYSQKHGWFLIIGKTHDEVFDVWGGSLNEDRACLLKTKFELFPCFEEKGSFMSWLETDYDSLGGLSE